MNEMKRVKSKRSMVAPRSRILESVHRSAKGLYEAGLMSESKMQEFDALCLVCVRKRLKKKDI